MAQKKKPAPQQKAILNRRARFDYELGDEIVAGLVLSGPEVRAARDGRVQLKGSFVTVRNNELWLNNASFSLKNNQKGQGMTPTVDTSPRKLLASRAQIDGLIDQKNKGSSIIPLKLRTSGKYIKMVIALGKGKKHHDKRETIKRRDQARDTQRILRDRY